MNEDAVPPSRTGPESAVGSLIVDLGGLFRLSALLVPTLVATACGPASQPQPLPPQTVTPAPSSASSPSAGSPGPSAPSEGEGGAENGTGTDPVDEEDVEPEKDGSLVVLEGQDSPPGTTSNRDLVEAARREGERRRTAGDPIAVIDDDNLSSHAEGGNVTVANPRSQDEEELREAREVLDRYSEKEEYWRNRARDIRLRWREAHDRVDELRSEATELRRRFYAEEDIALRDREIKPAWDRTRDLLREARETIGRSRDELDTLYAEGRRAGALEGWLREGIELEPDPEEPEETEEVQADEFREPPDR